MVLPGEAAGGESLRRLMLGGLPLLRRIALAAGRAGFTSILVADPRPDDGPLMAGTLAVPLRPEPALPQGSGRIVLLADSVVPQAWWLRQLAEMPLPLERAYIDGDEVAVVDVPDADVAWVVTSTARGASARVVFATLRRELKVEANAQGGGPDPNGRFALGGRADRPAAERWLLTALIKPGEALISRHFERRLSLALTRRLAGTRVTPNAMSLIMIAVGLLGAPCFLSARPGWQLVGSLLFLAHSILDGCDGELARLKFMESPAGATLDFWGDNIVHSAVFGCMAAGWSLGIGSPWPLALGAVVVGSTLAAAATLHRDPGPPEFPASGATVARSAVEAFSNRTFIYLVVALSAMGRAWWFLIPAAAGTPVFVALALLARRSRAQP